MFLLTKSYDDATDGYVNIGVFESLEELEEYVKEVFPEHKRDTEGDYYNDSEYGWSTKEYLKISTVDLIKENKD